MNYRMIGWNFISVYALAPRMKLFAINEMVANIVFSFIFLKVFSLGLTGVLLGTIFSTLLTVGWQDPYIIFKYGFNISPKPYFLRYLLNIIILLVELVTVEILKYVLLQVIVSKVIMFIILVPIIILICILVPLIFYHNSAELQYTTNLLKSLLKMG